jgi:hypothetical protein
VAEYYGRKTTTTFATTNDVSLGGSCFNRKRGRIGRGFGRLQRADEYQRCRIVVTRQAANRRWRISRLCGSASHDCPDRSQSVVDTVFCYKVTPGSGNVNAAFGLDFRQRCTLHWPVMSALGQKRTYAVHKPMSALPPIATAKAKFRKGPCLPLSPKADMCGAARDVRFGPKADFSSGFPARSLLLPVTTAKTI